MKTQSKKGTLKPLAAAIGLGLAMAAGTASAGVNWSYPETLFEDDDVDFLIKGAGNTQAGIIEEGDLLYAVVELTDSAGSEIQPEELTGLSIIEVGSIIPSGLPGIATIIFQPPTLGFDFYSGAAPLPDGAGAAGGGAMVAYYLDDTPELDISADKIVAGSPSCTTLALCTAQASDGDIWMVAGFDGDPDEYWVAPGAQLTTDVVNVGDPANRFGLFNAGLSVIVNQTGKKLVLNDLDCGVFCGAGGDGKVDNIGSGNINGGGENIIPSEWFATSDFDMTLKAVPTPGTLALFGVGLLGLGRMSRRNKA